jgi:CRISPR-associated protein Csm4
VSEPNAVIVLSTFQPGPDDPTRGAWQAFAKYGKLGPDFGLDNVFKRPMILFRPGACFFVESPRTFLGRAIGMPEILSKEIETSLLALSR